MAAIKEYIGKVRDHVRTLLREAGTAVAGCSTPTRYTPSSSPPWRESPGRASASTICATRRPR
jgi:hypothetical protein